jgi:hypothetical protein
LAEFLLTPSAERDLESIWRYSSLKWAADQADDDIEALLSILQCLADLPNSAPVTTSVSAIGGVILGATLSITGPRDVELLSCECCMTAWMRHGTSRNLQ